MIRFEPEQLRLYLVTDSELAGERDIVDIVAAAVKGGVTMVQLREKQASTREFVEKGIRLKALLEPLGIPLIINDRLDVALACDADGVHIGQSDMPYSVARRMLGPDRIIGLSVENQDELKAANGLDVDYLGISPVFKTPTKTDTAPAFGLDGFELAVKASVHPCVGIGGLNSSNVTELFARGAAGVAVVSAIISAPDVRKAAEELNELIWKQVNSN